MIDTTVLTIPKGSYKVIKPKKFKPYFSPINVYDPYQWMQLVQEHKRNKRYIQNPLDDYRDQGLVYPNIRIDESIRFNNNTKRDVYSCDLKVSFSCPKIIYGESVSTVTDIDFKELTYLLVLRLKEMGIEVTEDVIKNAIVTSVHYCTNIKFPSQEKARLLLSRLSKTSVGEWFENNIKTFANNGYAVRFHTTVFEIVFYLKYYDLLQNGKVSIGRKITKQEKEIAKKLRKDKKVPPVVRIELRFNGKASVRNHLKTVLGIKQDTWTFQSVFDSIKSKKVLHYYWRKIIDNPLNHFLLANSSDEDVCEKVQAEFKNEKTKNIDEALGLYFRLKTLGIKDIKDDIVTRHNRQTWSRKQEKIIEFIKRFVKQDDELIKLIIDALEGRAYKNMKENPIQMEIDTW